MKLFTILIILLALPFQLATKAETLRPSITIDANLSLDNSEFEQSPEFKNRYGFDYDFNQASMLLEIPASQFMMMRFGLERSSHNFKPRYNGGQIDVFRDGLRYATWNVRIGFRLYLDAN